MVNAADTIKLDRMLRILGLLTHSKVYLFWKKNQKNKKTCKNLKQKLVVSTHLRDETNILFNNILSSLFVFDLTDQRTQMKSAPFHFVSSQINRLEDVSFQTSKLWFQLISIMYISDK